MYTLQQQSNKSKARRGQLKTAHGVIETPFFMPIATKAAVKTLSSLDMVDLGAQILLSNTYHLMLRPGEELIKQQGGLHKFMNWNGPVLTDSGGYQVFSLAKMRKITDEGVSFSSHIDGTKYNLTPERSIAIQQALGSDIMMVLDECVPYPSEREYVAKSIELTTRWAKRCREVHDPKSGQLMFGIVQGSTYADLRQQSLEQLAAIDFDGYALGGLSVGEPQEEAFKTVTEIAPLMPADKPRYFMGGGKPEEIVYYVQQGIDMFDCVIPSRNARHGTLYTWNKEPSKAILEKDFYSKLIITNEEYRDQDEPIDKHCDCQLCVNYSRAYLRHLFSVQEMLAYRLATIHNIRFYMRLMKELRGAIEEGKL